MTLKQNVLQYLLHHQQQYSSGQQLAKQFNVSRTAIWKIIQALKNDGYAITSSTSKGYQLTKLTECLDESLIRIYTNNYTQDFIVFDSVSSTNDLAKSLVLQGASDGTLVVADHQSAGRGRQGHSFYSPAGSGVYFTIVLRPQGNMQHLLKTTLAAAVSVCEGIETCLQLRPQIKWVNDIFIEHKKVCGILTEATTDFESQQVDSILVGIGINCTKTAFPSELDQIAGSLSSDRIDRNQLVACIYTSFMKWKNRLHTIQLLNEYRNRSLLIGRHVVYMQNNQSHTGYVKEINEDGNLVIQKENGSSIILHSGEVSVKKWEYQCD